MKKQQVGLFLGLCLLVLAVVMAGCGSGAKNTTQPVPEMKVLRVGAIPAEDAQKTREAYKALTNYLEKKTGLPVELFVATDYSGVIEAMRGGKLDIAYFGPFSYVLAADKANAEAYAVEKRKGSGTSYKSLVITSPDSGIEKLADIKGRTYAFVDPASTSGNLIPRSFYKKNDIDPDKDFKSVVYAGGHDAAALAVKNHKVDAASMDDITYSNMKEKNLISDQDIKIIYQSDPIPGSVWAWRKDLPDTLKGTIKQAFLEVAKEDPAALSAYGGKVEDYAPANDADYNVIRETAKILNLDLSKK
ncbi:putative phosphite transport system-binding protein PtxB [Sporomusa silvacetica DSM 10669]|uniref:Phosphite transport system-binding protein PtxB n=2 Tax=Sporomusa silvacetica TaxID=55504 RepID=A0ABZ3ISM1_9FIRM|nr:phosphate-import protein PhnD precursor [Sporomusa silvacetica DSM 10669]